MSQVQTIPFQFQENQLNVIQLNEEPWFIAKEIATILEYRTANDATRILDEDEKGTHLMLTLGGNQEVTIINESGLYSLILKSKKPESKTFKRWVTHEVLPSIRKHGGYLTAAKTEELLTNPDLIIEMATRLKNERFMNEQLMKEVDHKNETIHLQDTVIKKQAPAVAYYEKVLSAEDSIPTNIIAKELGMSAKALNKILSEDYRIIYRQAGTWVPYARYQNMGLHKTKTFTYIDTQGQVRTDIRLVWTQAGRRFIHGLFSYKQ